MRPRQPSLFRAVCALLALALAGGPAAARDRERGLPLVQGFETGDVQTKGAVLAFAQTADGTLVVGSNQLVTFDGHRWEKIELPGAYAFRALSVTPTAPADVASAAQRAREPERVWVGASGALGFLERTAAGPWAFTSLLPQLEAAGVVNPGEVWSIHPVGGGAVFVTGQRVLRWDGRRFESWTLPAAARLQAFAGTGGRLWIFQPGAGLAKLEPDRAPELVYTPRDLPPGAILWGMEEGAAPAATREALLVATTEGLYRITGDSFAELPEISAAIRGNFPTCATALPDGRIAIGTFETGVLVAARTGEVQTTINSASGLAEDAVHALWADRTGHLWIGLGNGLARADALDGASLLDRRLGLGLGPPRKVLTHAGQTHLLMETGFFRLASTESPTAPAVRLAPVLTLQPLLRDAVSAHDRLWIAGFGGIWLAEAGANTRAHQVSADILHLSPVPSHPDELLFTEGNAMKELVLSAEGWTPRGLGQQLGDLPLSLVQDESGDVWVSTMLDGIYRFRFMRHDATPPWLHLLTRYRENRNLPSPATRPVLTTLGPHVLAFTRTDILAFMPAEDRFVRAPEVQDFVGIAAAPAGRDTAFWIVQPRNHGETAPYALLRVQTGAAGLEWAPLRAPGLDNLGQIEHLDATESATGTVLWIAGARGLLRLELDQLGPAAAPPPTVLRLVRHTGAQPATLTPTGPPSFGPESQQVEFSFSASATALYEPIFYQTRLEGVDAAWSPPRREAVREFTGLAPGTYAFMARAVDRFGRTGAPVDYPFRVIAPWYRRAPAITGYIALAALLATALVRWRLRHLHRQTEKLNRLVAERTRHLELVNTAKSEFLENISHEIRNPLNGIVGLAHMFQEERLGPHERELARSLKASVEHLRRVSEDVLSFSALEYGELSLEEKTFTLATLLTGVADLYRVSARQHGNTLTLTLAPEATYPVLGDASKIEAIVGNLVSNAIKYAPGSPVEIRADCEATSDGLNAVISVSDQGAGVPAEEQELIFQKFVRGTNAKTAKVTGTGIGLAACRVLARAIGGSVGVESEPGHGATFHLWLPLKSAPATAAPPVRGGLALIVEDEEYNRIVLRGTAEALGYRATAVGDATEALALLDQKSFDVLLLDWELPGATKGPDLARAVRARPDGDRPVILAVTAHNSEDVRRRAREAGMDAFLLKPVDTAHVGQVIARVLAQRVGAGESPPDSPPESPAAGDAGETPLNFDAFRLYARSAPEHAPDPPRRFVTALDDELATIARAITAADMPAAASAAHRLRALAALVHATQLNRAAQHLQELALAGADRTVLDEASRETSTASEELKRRIPS